MTPEERLAFDLGREIGKIEGRAEMEALADQYYRAAFDDERRPQSRAIVTREELEEQPRDMAARARRRVTVEDALHSWGIDPAQTTTPATVAPATTPTSATPAAPSGTTHTIRRRTMSYINLTRALASTPVLREGTTGPYTYATVIVTDRFLNDDGEYIDGPKMAYELAVSGAQATGLVATAKACGNIRVAFSGDYTVREFTGEKGTFLEHKVRVDQIGASFRNQNITVERHAPAAKAGEE